MNQIIIILTSESGGKEFNYLSLANVIMRDTCIKISLDLSHWLVTVQWCRFSYIMVCGDKYDQKLSKLTILKDRKVK